MMVSFISRLAGPWIPPLPQLDRHPMFSSFLEVSTFTSPFPFFFSLGFDIDMIGIKEDPSKIIPLPNLGSIPLGIYDIPRSQNNYYGRFARLRLEA
jgi:hypothetical protein